MKITLIRFDVTFLIVALGFMLTGYFLNLLVFTSLIIIHELGHYFICRIENIKVQEIVIYPYGGLTKVEDFINRDIDKELLVAVFGIVFQSLYFFLIIIIYNFGLIREYTFLLFKEYHFSMLIFNLLPIYPLDGFKIINLFLSKKISYKKSNNITLFISFLTILTLFFVNYYKFNYTYIIILTTLITNLIVYYKKLSYIFNKFLLERYLYNINYNEIKIIKDHNKMYKNKSHIIKKNGKYYKEDIYLKNLFDKDNHL